ncbi:MAG: diguanylate cyclase, partial [Gammaproteobacteria bacterium]
QTASSLASIALQGAHTREELARSQSRLTEIAAAMPGVIFQQVQQQDGLEFSYVAEGAEELLGVDAESLMKDASLLWSRVDERDRCIIDQVLAGQVEGTLSKECWFRLHMPDGSLRWIEAHARRINEGDKQGWAGIFLDATEQYERERRLHRAGLVFDHAQEGIMITDAELRILEVNPAFTRITGYEAEEAVGQTPRILSSGRHGRAFYREMWDQIRSQGHWEGEIWNRRKDGEIYPEWLSITTARDPRSGETQYIGVFTDISRLKQSEEELAHLAHHDMLTGLPNRLMFHLRLDHALARARRDGRQVALLFLDLDRFKNLNDTLGHAFGDQILRQVAARLERVVREQDLVARLGGDEFVILLEDLKDTEASGRVAEALIEVLRQPYTIENREYFLSASIGISHFPADGEQADDLLRAADLALYQAKEEGRSTWRVHQPELTRRVEAFVNMEAALRQALEREELCLYYQPKVDARTRQVIGAEALIRWEHPEQGLIPPNHFLPL